jgi:hypothetical protein
MYLPSLSDGSFLIPWLKAGRRSADRVGASKYFQFRGEEMKAASV